MSEFENIVIGKSALPALTVSVVLLVAIPVVFALYWCKSHKQETNLGWLFIGAAGFVVSARVLELGVHYFCIISDNGVSRFINGNTAAYVLYGILMAGVFEECGRFIIMKYLLKKNRTPENAVLYGIGHGGIEVLTVVLPGIISGLVIVALFSSGDRASAMQALNITEETAAAALPTVQSVAGFNFAGAALTVTERLITMFAHIGFTVIVYYGISNACKVCLPAAILLHMLMDTFPALGQRGVVPAWAVEIWAAAWTVVIMVIAVKLYKKMKA